MVIVGIDPGLTCPGICVYNASDSRIIAWKAFPQKKTNKKNRDHYHGRIRVLTNEMYFWAEKWLPDMAEWCAAIEGPAYAKVGFQIQLAAHRQALFEAFGSLDDPIIVPPHECRRAVTGNGAAKKPMGIACVRRMIPNEWKQLYETALAVRDQQEVGALADSYSVALAGARIIRHKLLKELI